MGITPDKSYIPDEKGLKFNQINDLGGKLENAIITSYEYHNNTNDAKSFVNGSQIPTFRPLNINKKTISSYWELIENFLDSKSNKTLVSNNPIAFHSTYGATFTGTQYLDFDDNSHVHYFTGYDKLVVHLEIRPTSLASSKYSLVGRGSNSDHSVIVEILDSKIRFSLKTKTSNITIISTTSMSINTSYAYTCVYDGNTVKIYKDGILDSPTGIFAGKIKDIDLDMKIGTNSLGANQYEGYMKNLTIWRGSLDAEQIKTLNGVSTNLKLYATENNPFVVGINGGAWEQIEHIEDIQDLSTVSLSPSSKSYVGYDFVEKKFIETLVRPTRGQKQPTNTPDQFWFDQPKKKMRQQLFGDFNQQYITFVATVNTTGGVRQINNEYDSGWLDLNANTEYSYNVNFIYLPKSIELFFRRNSLYKEMKVPSITDINYGAILSFKYESVTLKTMTYVDPVNAVNLDASNINNLSTGQYRFIIK